MVVRVEERVACVASPSRRGDAGARARRVCTAAFEQNRYAFFAVDALLVVLHESHAHAVPANPRSEARRCSQFDLWQVWNTLDAAITCVRFNATSRRTARGAVALCLGDGRVALLTPTMAASHLTTAAASRLSIKTAESELKPDVTREYAKVHLHLHLPTWQESVRWRADDDRLMDRVEWVESGDDLWLVGAGEKITTWKLVEESGVVAYQQLSFAVAPPEQRVWHMDATPTGRFVATAGVHDRVLKLWSLQELAHDGTPVCLFLAHGRALVSAAWATPRHAFKLKAGSGGGPQCEMLYTLDRSGAVSIWRENVASPSRAFTLWKRFDSHEFVSRSAFGDVERRDDDDDDDKDDDASLRGCSPLRSFSLVVNDWGRAVPRASVAFTEVLLEEANVQSALSQFHYGYTSLDDVRRHELFHQRMDVVSKANAKMMGGGRSGAVADTHAGEACLVGNTPLAKTFLVHLGVGVHENGDVSLYRVESTPFAGSSPRTSLLCQFSGLQKQLAGATVFTVCSADFKDRENGVVSFFLEMLFQPVESESQLKLARLKLQVESGGGSRGARASATYAVQMCEVGDASPSLLSSFASATTEVSTSLDVAKIHAGAASVSPCSATLGAPLGHVVVATHAGHVDLLRAGSTIGPLTVAGALLASTPTHTALWARQRVLFSFANGRLRATSLLADGLTSGVSAAATAAGAASTASSVATPKMLFCDDETEPDGIEELIVAGVASSQKKAWSSAPTSFFFAAAAPVETLTVVKDFCVAIALRRDRRSLVVWVFSIEPPPSTEEIEVALPSSSSSSSSFSPSTSCPLQLFKRVAVDVPDNQRLRCLAAVPSLDASATLFASVSDDATHTLSLWGFADMDDMAALQRVHATDVATMLQAADSPVSAQDAMMQFSSSATRYAFRRLAVSACGRAALLFEEAVTTETSAFAASSASPVGGGDFCVCVVSLVDSWHESVVTLERKKLGEVVALQWTPPRAPSLDCQLVVLTATAIGVIRLDETSPRGAWAVAWTSSRLTARPRALSGMARFPQAFLSLGTGVAELNLEDLMGSTTTTTTTPVTAGRGALPTTDVASNAAHPISLLFLLMRGSFASLDRTLMHIREAIVDHEKTCYLKMLDDQELRRLPFMGVELLLGKRDAKDERSATYTRGKTSGGAVSFGGGARASDLFAMDFGSVRRSSLALGLGGAGVFGSASASSSAASSPADPALAAPDSLALESSELAAFFADHKASLAFLPADLRGVFLELVAGSKKIVAWDKDATRAKDEPALRFAASLLWPFRPLAAAGTAVATPGRVDGEDAQAASPLAVGGICSEQVAWAALSGHQSELLQESLPAAAFSLLELTQLRLPFWLQSAAKLAQLTEKAAQAEYAATRDPFRVALLYVLLGKRKLLVSLFKLANESKIADLLANDFGDARWRNAAVKNAYVLKAKRRHALSATFFVLGGKVQEAMAVAEHADRSLVLPFLIARLAEKWDFGDGGSSASDALGGDLSFTGLSANMRSLGAVRAAADGGGGGGGDAATGVCKEYLTTVVGPRARACGDVYVAFLVRYLVGETAGAVQALLAVPRVDVTCMFDAPPSSDDDARGRGLYWRVFGQSLLGASELVRFLKPAVPRWTSAMNVQAARLEAIALDRLFALGGNVAALYQQRDAAPQFVQLAKETAPESSAVRAALLAARGRILGATLSGQTDALSSAVVHALQRTLVASRAEQRVPAVPTASLEDTLDAEIQCLLVRGGRYSVVDLPETQDAATEASLRTTALDTLRQAGRASVEDFVVAHWLGRPVAGTGTGGSPLLLLVEAVVDGVARVGSGDLTAAATSPFYAKHADQLCGELLAKADELLLWLAYLFHGARPHASFSSPPGGAEWIRVAAAAVYSVLCVGARFAKSPCCVLRALHAIFPHLDALPRKTQDELHAIALANVCAHCAAARTNGGDRAAPLSSSFATGASPLQRDLPALRQIVHMLRAGLTTVVEEVRTHRLELAPPASLFSFCQYWTLVLCVAASKMAAHVTKVAVDGASPHANATLLARKLAQTWAVYAANLNKHAGRGLLCELTESFFRPFTAARAASASTPAGSTPGTPRESGGAASSSSSANAASPSSALAAAAAVAGASGVASPVLAPLGRDRREARRLLRCACDRCPWVLALQLFVDTDELLLRINSQLECCGEKIKDEISWGLLPDFPSRKAALTRSQKILLSSATATSGGGAKGGGPELSELLEKRLLQAAPSVQLDAHCIYRSDVSIKSLCFNRATETAAPELVLCSSKGVCRTAAVEYSDGTKYQFKGMYASPQAGFVADSGGAAGPTARRKTADSAAALMRVDSPQRAAGGGDGNGSNGGGSLAEMKTPSFKPTAVESHPFLPLFVSGNQKGKLHLWSYESLSAVCEFQTRDVVAPYPLSPALSSRRDIKKIRFDSLGQQMGAVDSVGRLLVWKFANLDREPCYRELDCHDKGAKALRFVNSSSVLATVGSSSDVCLWDLLLPNSKALVAAPACHPAGAASVAFSPSHQLLISGGEGGAISVFDVRQRRVLHTISNAHETAITTLELHPSGRCVLSGSASGDVKIWSLPIFRELVAVSKVHAKPSFLGDAASNLLGDAASNMAINVTNSSWGVTDAFATDDYFFTSGTDGSVQRFRIPSLGKLL